MALALHRPVAELQQTITSEEFTHWQAYHRLSPISSIRGDHQAALVAFTIAQANRGKKGPTLKFDDFVLKYGQRERVTDPAKILQQLNLYAGVSNGNS